MAVKTGTVILAWADGEYPFRLAIGEWQELYRKTLRLLMQLGVSEPLAMESALPMAIYNRIGKGNPIPGEVPEIIFQALIGGGMAPRDAAPLRKRYGDDRPLLESIPVAQAVILHSLMGPSEAEPKKAEAGGMPSSPSAESTETARPSVTRRKKLMK